MHDRYVILTPKPCRRIVRTSVVGRRGSLPFWGDELLSTVLSACTHLLASLRSWPLPCLGIRATPEKKITVYPKIIGFVNL